MGNQQKQLNYEGFQESAHLALKGYDLDINDQYLYRFVELDPELIEWRRKIGPLLEKKYLLFPAKIHQADIQFDIGCCSMERPQHIPPTKLKISYEPFIYCLNNEILTRKNHNRCFREQEIWKILIYLTKGIVEWQSIYPNSKLGTICPENIGLNCKGNLKIICNLSFPKYVPAESFQIYMPPESRTSSVIKYTFNPNKDSNAIRQSMVYSLGVVLLETITLELSPFSKMPTQQKLILLQDNLKYSPDLKNTICRMIEDHSQLRPNVKELLHLGAINKNKYL